MMQPALQTRVGQQLTVTPQLQQAIGLLQLSTQELEVQLKASLESNVFLEVEEEGEEVVAPQDGELAGDWRGASDSSPGGALPEIERAAPDADLRAHLRWQVGMSSLSERDRSIAEVIIDAIGDDGYLEAGTDALLETLAGSGVTPDEVEAVRQYVLHLDPVGCAAGSLAECLRTQIDCLGVPVELARCAHALAGFDLTFLAAADERQLAEMTGRSTELARQALDLVRGLQPFPGRRIGGEAATTIVPDVLVRRRRGRWVVELNPDVLPRVRLNRLYESLLSECRQSQGHSAMHNQLQEARWLLKSVQMRNETLLKVAAAIMQHQNGFLERGELAMKPMVLREIAEAVEMHESTVSRVTTRKYIQTPRGNFELKYFFSSRLATRNGSSCSGTAVRALVRRLIDQENPAEPLSDGQIGRLLASRGVRIARRTVAKYREALNIPPLAERQALADRHTLPVRTAGA